MAGNDSITTVRDKLQRAKAALARYRQEGEQIAAHTSHAVLTAGGGAIAGAVRVYQPLVPGTQIPLDLALGVAVAGAGIVGAAGEWSDEAVSLGGGLLAASLAKVVEDALR
jgi:hypothetical protein